VTTTATTERLPSRSAVTTQSTGRGRFPARPVEAAWPATRYDRARVLQLMTAKEFVLGHRKNQNSRVRGIRLLLDWLAEHPGVTWQERWLATGADAAGAEWSALPAVWLEHRGQYSSARLELMTNALGIAIGVDLIRPSLAWLLTGGKKRKLSSYVIRSRDPEGFTQLHRLCEQDPAISTEAHAHTLFRTAVIVTAKGGGITDITIGDVLEILDAEVDHRPRGPKAGSASFRCSGSWASSARAFPPCARSAASGSCRWKPSSTATRSPAIPSGSPGRLSEGTPTRDRLQHTPEQHLPVGQVLLVRP
jgi:hypothetical protein